MQFEAVACRLFLHYFYTLAQKASNYGIFCFYYMVDHAEYIIGVFDNQKKLRSGTAQTVNYALHKGKVITLIHPDTMEITAPAP